MLLKKRSLWAAALFATGLCLTSCSKDDENSAELVTAEETAILGQYVDHVVVETYRNLADASIKLEDAVKELESNKIQANVDKACAAWKVARKSWEQSEAFLYGAAADYGIDPHIDSWPLDKAALDDLLNNNAVMSKFDTSYAIDNLNGGLLGFHALEYVLFRDGQPRAISDITSSANQLKYAVGVAGDLAVQTTRLEVAWAGLDNVTKAKQDLLKDYELEPTRNYGEELKLSGKAGSYNKTGKAGIEDILSGAIAIADEVGNAKINDPVESGEVLDVESWYSWNSLTDFQNNVIGIQNAYLGGVAGKRNAEKSVSAYIKKKNSTLDKEITEAITSAINEIKAIGEPFRNNLTKAKTDKAIKACNHLKDKLEEAKTAVSK